MVAAKKWPLRLLCPEEEEEEEEEEGEGDSGLSVEAL